MGRRVAAALVIAAAVLLVTAGCGNDSADPAPLPTVRFSFGDTTAPAGSHDVDIGAERYRRSDQASSPNPGPTA